MYYDLLAKIKNAELAKKSQFIAPFSKMDFCVAKVLAEADYIKDVQKKVVARRNFMEIKLAYHGNRPALSDFRILSKPSRRLYTKPRQIRLVKQGYGLGIISTSRGIMSDKEAKKNRVGGEYLCEVW